MPVLSTDLIECVRRHEAVCLIFYVWLEAIVKVNPKPVINIGVFNQMKKLSQAALQEGVLGVNNGFLNEMVS